MTTTVVVIITNEQNSFKEPKWKFRRQKEMEEYREEISTLDEMSKGVKVKTMKARQIERNYVLT